MLRWIQSIFSTQAGNTTPASAEPPVARPVAPPMPPAPAALSPGERFPAGYAVAGEGTADVFDPALRHLGRAFRRGDPVFDDLSQEAAWFAARQGLIDHVLGLIAASPWGRRLALRGSALMPALVGPAARPPRDIDWMVLPPGLKVTDPSGLEIIDEVGRLVASHPDTALARLEPDSLARDRIWTYERAEGVRLTFAWSAPGLPRGSLQLDFVFGEPLAELAEETAVPLGGGEMAVMPAASAELSLCWKLIWLADDSYPQGKDLYDAVLLAECVRPDLALLQRVFEPALSPAQLALGVRLPAIAYWEVDWKNFLLEYPAVAGDVDEWKQRLTVALGPQLADSWC